MQSLSRKTGSEVVQPVGPVGYLCHIHLGVFPGIVFPGIWITIVHQRRQRCGRGRSSSRSGLLPERQGVSVKICLDRVSSTSLSRGDVTLDATRVHA